VWRISPPKDHYENITHCLHLLDGPDSRLVRAGPSSIANHERICSNGNYLTGFDAAERNRAIDQEKTETAF